MNLDEATVQTVQKEIVENLLLLRQIQYNDRYWPYFGSSTQPLDIFKPLAEGGGSQRAKIFGFWLGAHQAMETEKKQVETGIGNVTVFRNLVVHGCRICRLDQEAVLETLGQYGERDMLVHASVDEVRKEARGWDVLARMLYVDRKEVRKVLNSEYVDDVAFLQWIIDRQIKEDFEWDSPDDDDRPGRWVVTAKGRAKRRESLEEREKRLEKEREEARAYLPYKKTKKRDDDEEVFARAVVDLGSKSDQKTGREISSVLSTEGSERRKVEDKIIASQRELEGTITAIEKLFDEVNEINSRSHSDNEFVEEGLPLASQDEKST